MAHYPPYTSKYHPIEHRLFPHVTRACQGVILQTVEQVRYYMAKTQTSTGLKVLVHVLDQGCLFSCVSAVGPLPSPQRLSK